MATNPDVHTVDYRRAQREVLNNSDITTRTIDVGGRPVHVLERGVGRPALVLHGTGSGAAFLRPLLDRLDGVRVIAPDRPGQGLSAPTDTSQGDVRTRAVSWIDHFLDASGCDRITLLGHSMGGLWSLWYALAHPERVVRLVLLAPPQLPGTRCPLPYRVMGTPGLFRVVQRVSPPSREASLRFAAFMGEGDTIAEHPDLLELMTVASGDPTNRNTNVAEARSIISPLALLAPSGFRRSRRVSTDELREVNVPTLLIWGEREPLGPVDVARNVVRLIPGAQLEVVPAGHAPWLGRADLTAGAVNRFVDHDAPAPDDEEFDPSGDDAELGIAPDAPTPTASVPSISRRPIQRGGAS